MTSGKKRKRVDRIEKELAQTRANDQKNWHKLVPKRKFDVPIQTLGSA